MRRTRDVAMLVLVLAGVVLFAGCTGWGFRRSRTFRGKGGVKITEAKHAIMAGNLSEARGFLHKALDAGPSAEAHYYLALIALEETAGPKFDVALSEAGKSIQDYPSPQGLLVRGALLEESKPAEAIQCYVAGLDKAEGRHPAVPLLHRNLAALYARQGDYAKAFTHMGEFVQRAESEGRRLGDADQALWGLLLYDRGHEARARAAWVTIRDARLRHEIDEAVGGTL